jgi:hypothetical protein
MNKGSAKRCRSLFPGLAAAGIGGTASWGWLLIAHLGFLHREFIMAIKNSSGKNLVLSFGWMKRTANKTAVAPDTASCPPVANGEARPMLGKKRQAKVIDKTQAPVVDKPTWTRGGASPRRTQHTPKFTRGTHAEVLARKPNALQEMAAGWIKEVATYSKPVRQLPHFRRNVKVSELLGQWRMASKVTEASLQDGLQPSHRLGVIDAELKRLDAAEIELRDCIEKFSPLWVNDRREVRAALDEISRRRETLLARKEGLHEAIEPRVDPTFAQKMGLRKDLIDAYTKVCMEMTPKTTKLEPVGQGVGVAGEGAVHSVVLVDCTLPDPLPGQPRTVTKVFKAEPNPRDGLPSVAGVLGISPRAQNLSGRAVATYELDQLLNTGLIPRTAFAVYQDDVGALMDWADGVAPQRSGKAELPVSDTIAQWGRKNPQELQRYAQRKGFRGATVQGSTIVFQRVREEAELDEDGAPRRGADGHIKVNKVAEPISLPPGSLAKDPVYLARLSDASCLGFLSNQADWHGGNYKIQFDEQGKVANLSFFDNDLSFGIHSEGSHFDIEARFGGGSATHMTHLPPVITQRMYETVMSMSADDIADRLKHLLAPDDISAAQERLARLQAHCLDCKQNGAVLGEADLDWGQEGIQKAFGLDLLEAARGNLAALEALTPELTRANLPARELLAMYLAEARSLSGQVADPEDAVVFDAERFRGELGFIAAAA